MLFNFLLFICFFVVLLCFVFAVLGCAQVLLLTLCSLLGSLLAQLSVCCVQDKHLPAINLLGHIKTFINKSPLRGIQVLFKLNSHLDFVVANYFCFCIKVL